VDTTITLYGFPHQHQTARYLAVVTSPPGAVLQGEINFVPGGSKNIFNNHAMISRRWPISSFGSVVSIQAFYSGDQHHSPSASNVFFDTIPKGSSFIRLVSSSPTSQVGQSVTFFANLHPGGGDGSLMTFYDGNNILGTAPLQGGGAVFTTALLPAGSRGIRAYFPGDTQFTPSYAGTTQQVNKYATTTTLNSSLNPSQQKQPVTFTVAVSSPGPSVPTGAIRFMDGTAWLGSGRLLGGTATLTHKFAAGTHSISAVFLGDSASAPSTSAVLSQVVQ
jgi:hypothetical protein